MMVYSKFFKQFIEKGWKPGTLYVLNYHNTPKIYLENFKNQLNYLAQHFEFIRPNDLLNSQWGKEKKPKMIITFDDGIKSNLNTIPILDEFNIKALFFVVYNFIHSKEPTLFYRKNIRFNPNLYLESSKEDITPMSHEDLKLLIQKGHSIGFHTASHDMRELLKWNEDRIFYEFILSKRLLEIEIGSKIVFFASPIDSRLIWKKIGLEETIHENYDCHFLTIGGINYKSKNLTKIKRINLEAYLRVEQVLFRLSKFEALRWKLKS